MFGLNTLQKQELEEKLKSKKDNDPFSFHGTRKLPNHNPSRATLRNQ